MVIPSSRTDLRSVVLRAAAPLFARFGFKKTSVDEIARAAHISKATLYHHFKSKEEVFAAVIRHEGDAKLDTIQRAVAKGTTAEEKLRAFVRAHDELLREAITRYEMSNETLRELVPLAHEVSCGAHERSVQLLTTILQQGIDDGSFFIKDAGLIARALHTAIHNHDVLLADERDNPEFERGNAALLELMLRGLTSPEGDE